MAAVMTEKQTYTEAETASLERFRGKYAYNLVAKVTDDRCTGIGKVIRRWHIGELPQILKALKGEMRIMGPRPEREFFCSEFEKYIPDYRTRLLGDHKGAR